MVLRKCSGTCLVDTYNRHMPKKPKLPKFTLQAMQQVVDHYRRFRLQPVDCPECRYLPMPDGLFELPEGFEPMREGDGLISQCEEHNKPLYPWLTGANRKIAANWLVKRGNASPSGILTIGAILEDWENALKRKDCA